MGWEIFERAAPEYERWYTTARGRRADIAERALLKSMLSRVPGARSLLEAGAGTGHFAGWLAESGFEVVGLERAPAMLDEARRNFPAVRFVLADAHRLPFRDAAVDILLFVTTLEFLENPVAALREAVRVARRGIVVLALNRCSLGGLSRRFGSQSRGAILGRARDYSLGRLRREMREAAGGRVRSIHWSSALFPDGLWNCVAKVPLGDVIAMLAELKTA